MFFACLICFCIFVIIRCFVSFTLFLYYFVILLYIYIYIYVFFNVFCIIIYFVFYFIYYYCLLYFLLFFIIILCFLFFLQLPRAPQVAPAPAACARAQGVVAGGPRPGGPRLKTAKNIINNITKLT